MSVWYVAMYQNKGSNRNTTTIYNTGTVMFKQWAIHHQLRQEIKKMAYDECE